MATKYTNIHRTARISPKKVRQVGELIRGKDIEAAFALLQHNKRRSAVFLDNALKAAVANADQANFDGDAEGDACDRLRPAPD